jgi:hypothetical protein
VNRPLALAVAIVTTAFLAGAAASAAAPARSLESPNALELSATTGWIRDSALPNRSRRLSVALGAAAWGGRYPTGSGEDVRIYVSDRYPPDPATTQRWASFLGGLLHGRELGQLTVYLAPLAEVQSICGAEASACYSSERSLLVAPGEDLPDGTSAEAVIAHEYGHHMAAHRLNPPWAAVEWGTKRWASYLQVCAKARSGTLFPGAETYPNYRLNPGEAFAESYRVLNQRRAGVPEAPWDVVDQSLYPDERALSLLQEDVVAPWQSNAVQRLRGRGSRSYAVTAAYDGRLSVTLKASPKARFSLVIARADGARVAGARTRARVTRATATATVCGQRTFTIRVARTSRTGSYALTISRP